jgi:opacity protein-like surface antigen
MMRGVGGTTPRNIGIVMRHYLLAVALIAMVTDAFAGEFELPTLRGSASPYIPAPPVYTRWSGFYAGAQIGFGSMHVDFTGATQSMIAHQLRETAIEHEVSVSEWKVLGQKDTGSVLYGAFAGYNTQWDDIVIGVDVNFNHPQRFWADAPISPLSRVTSAAGNTYAVTVSGNARMQIEDFAVARLRAGWVVDSFMPYATVGFAVGRGNTNRSATVSGFETTPNNVVTPFSFTESETRNNAYLFGWAVGGGLDVLMWQGLFLRGEFEYVAFASISGMKSSINTGRLGAGWKF